MKPTYTAPSAICSNCKRPISVRRLSNNAKIFLSESITSSVSEFITNVFGLKPDAFKHFFFHLMMLATISAADWPQRAVPDNVSLFVKLKSTTSSMPSPLMCAWPLSNTSAAITS